MQTRHRLHNRYRVWRVGEGERVDGIERVTQSAERIRAVATVVGHRGSDQRMRDLQQQRPRTAAKQYRDFAVDQPGDTARPEQAVDVS